MSGSLTGYPVYQTGDTNHNGLLDPGETWVYTSTVTLKVGGYYLDNALATGLAVDGQATPAEQATTGVELTAPAQYVGPTDSPEIPATSVTSQAPLTLPATGTDTLPLLLLGAALVASGGMILVLSARRR